MQILIISSLGLITFFSACIIRWLLASGFNQQKHAFQGKQDEFNSLAKKNSLLFEGVDIGRYAKVRNAILDKGVKLMPNATVGYDLEADKKRFTVTEKGIVVVEKGAVIEAK